MKNLLFAAGVAFVAFGPAHAGSLTWVDDLPTGTGWMADEAPESSVADATARDVPARWGPFRQIVFSGLPATLGPNGLSQDDVAAPPLGATASTGFDVNAVGAAAVLIPEPASWALLIVGSGGIGGMLRARRRKTVQSFA